jgi:hypothetical protein
MDKKNCIFEQNAEMHDRHFCGEIKKDNRGNKTWEITDE